MRILRGAGQSAASLQRKLERRGYTADAAGDAVRRCAASGYVNDAAMAASVAARHRRAGHGRARVAADLRAKGVAAELISEALDGQNDTEEAAALAVAQQLWERTGRRGASRSAGAHARRRRAAAPRLLVVAGRPGAARIDLTVRLARMEYTHLGRSGLSVSRLCLGTMNFGPETDEATSHQIMDAALDAGLNFFDTANVYGWKKGEGITEQIVGRWFAQGGGRREKVVIATKLYGSMSDWPNDTFLSARNIRECLRRLAPAPADRSHRPLSDAPRRPEHAVRRDLGGDGGAGAAGQGALRRLVELRGLDDRAGAGGGASPPLPRPRQRAVPVQPRRAPRRGGGDTGGAALRRRHHRVEPADARPARRHPRQAARHRPVGVGRRRRSLLAKHRDKIERYEAFCATARRASRRPSGSPGCSGSRASPDRSSGRGPSSSSRATCTRSTCTSTTRRSRQLDAIFPGPGPAPEVWAW